MKKKYFVSFIVGYFPALHAFDVYQNYYLYPLILAKELGFKPVVIIKEGEECMKNDPNLPNDLLIIEYKNFPHFLYLLSKYSFLGSLFYINNHGALSYIAIFFSKLFFCKNIFMGHIQPKRTTKIRQYIFDLVIFFTNRVRLNNLTEKSFLLGRGFSHKKLYIVPFAFNSTVFYKKTFDYKKRSDLVYYGNTTKQKGIPVLLEAVSIVKETVPGILFHIVGSRGDYNPDIDIAKYQLENNVVQHGAFKHGEALNTLLNQFSVFIISTKAEGVCMAVYEAALAGNALCLPNIMSFENTFKGKALFHDVSDAHKLAENILIYLQDQNLIQNYNEKCRKMILSEFDEKTIKKELIQLLSF